MAAEKPVILGRVNFALQQDKQLWLLAGGNGAGKSTFYRCFLEAQGIKFVNADIIAKQIDKNNPEKVSYEAAAKAAKLRSSLLRKGISFCFETVFSHSSKIDFVAEAKAFNYQVILVYIHLQNTELNLARIAQRVTEGGHNVPEDKVLSRIPRTIANIRTALPLFERVQFYDNSSRDNPFQSIAQIKNQVLIKNVDSLPDWAVEILDGFDESVQS